MGKRGRKAWEAAGAPDLVPLRVIAVRLGLSERTAWTVYASALRKLRDAPDAEEALRLGLAVRSIFERDLLRAASAECDAEFVAKWRA